MRTLLLFLLSISFSSCFIGRKVPEGTTIRIVNNATVSNRMPSDSPYWQGKSEQECVAAFMNGISSELEFYKVKVVTAGDADYELMVDRIELSETLNNETVNDPNSPYNGKTFQLADITVTASGDISNIKNKEHRRVNGLGSRQEKISNNRNLGDLIFGSNKDNTTYRLKSLPDNVVVDMSERAGRRVATDITRKLKKIR